jgi:hypothetical protein
MLDLMIRDFYELEENGSIKMIRKNRETRMLMLATTPTNDRAWERLARYFYYI